MSEKRVLEISCQNEPIYQKRISELSHRLGYSRLRKLKKEEDLDKIIENLAQGNYVVKLVREYHEQRPVTVLYKRVN
jgi:hypothetical protein